MQRSSESDDDPAGGCTRSSSRGQVEPLAAIAAVLAVGAGLALYAGAVDDVFEADSDRETADIALDRGIDALSETGIVVPETINRTRDIGPAGWHLNVTVRAQGVNRSVGPTPPPRAERASERVGVRAGPGVVNPGRVRVVVWT
ncbi:MAG: hypothetical protein V5A55_04500 [Halovenus sp.]